MTDRSAPLRRAEGFGMEVAAAAVLGAVAWWIADPGGTWLGWPGQRWMAAALAVPVVHQLLVAVGWRAELFDRWFTRHFGDGALLVFGALFFPPFLLRPVVVFGVAAADRGSLWAPGPASFVAAALMAGPALWTFSSVIRYFGIRRALGLDHFEPDLAEPLVRRGAFAVIPNAMYTLGFLVLWAIAVAAGSQAALAAAGFQHAFIWAHYWAIERPDMQVIYRSRPIEP